MCSSLFSMRSNEAYMREKGSSFLVDCQTLSRCGLYDHTSAPSVHCIDIRYQVGRIAHRPDAPRHNELFWTISANRSRSVKSPPVAPQTAGITRLRGYGRARPTARARRRPFLLTKVGERLGHAYSARQLPVLARASDLVIEKGKAL